MVKIDGVEYVQHPADMNGHACTGCAGQGDQVLCARLPILECLLEEIIWKERGDEPHSASPVV